MLRASVDIDHAVKSLYPQDSRWDFAVGYSGEVYFIEVHPAETSNVAEMLCKVQWLKNWLAGSAPDLKKLHKSEMFYWIPPGRVNILRNSVQYKKIAANNLSVKNSLELK